MAVAGVEAIYTIRDRKDKTAETTIYAPSGFTVANYKLWAGQLAEVIDGLLSGRVDTCDIGFAVDISALTGNTADPASDVEETGEFQFVTSEGRPVMLVVPGINELLVTTGTDELDQTEAAVAAVIAMMESGLVVAAATIQPTDVGEIDISTTVYAVERFRNSGKRRK